MSKSSQTDQVKLFPDQFDLDPAQKNLLFKGPEDLYVLLGFEAPYCVDTVEIVSA